MTEEPTSIFEFQGEYRWLSNFWPAPVTFDGLHFPSVENAYQAAKTDKCNRSQFQTCTAGQAKRLGRTVEVREDWERVRVDVMRDLIAQKFAPGTALSEKLLGTGDQEIIEGNRWGDTFWGVCQGHGQNWLGRLLMEHRLRLRSQC